MEISKSRRTCIEKTGSEKAGNLKSKEKSKKLNQNWNRKASDDRQKV